MAGDQVHVPFDYYRVPAGRDSLAGQVKPEESPSFCKYRRFGRIQILRLNILHGAAAKSDRPPLDVQDREDEPVPEPVPQPLLPPDEQPGPLRVGRGHALAAEKSA